MRHRVVGLYGRAYAWPWFLRRFFPARPGLRTIGFAHQVPNPQRSPGADEHVNFRTASREPRIFRTHHRPARLAFKMPKRVTIREADLGTTKIPAGKRGGYLIITKFTDDGFGVEEHSTDGDQVTLDVYY